MYRLHFVDSMWNCRPVCSPTKILWFSTNPTDYPASSGKVWTPNPMVLATAVPAAYSCYCYYQTVWSLPQVKSARLSQRSTWIMERQCISVCLGSLIEFVTEVVIMFRLPW